jgi:hypothetical protein
MELIDAAADSLDKLLSQIKDYYETISSEEDTRLKIINRILTEILGWPYSEIYTEEQSGEGFIDYKLTINGYARLVVEAKRDGRELGLLGRTSGHSYKLSGPVFRNESAKEGIAQAIRYCGQKNAELACVTNGREWLVFRGSRLGDGKDTMEGMCFVFASLEDVSKHFTLFYNLLSYEMVKNFHYRAHFQEVEGRLIRVYPFRKPVRPPESRNLIMPNSQLSADIDRIMSSFFRRLSDDRDPEMLIKCFVVTKESNFADDKLIRISEELIGRIRSLDTSSGAQLTAVVDRVRTTQRNEFVLLIGTKGSGKTTFIDRFFQHVLPAEIRKDCIIARVNLADSDGDEQRITSWLDQHLLHALEKAIFGDQAPTFNQLEGVFYDEYNRRRVGPLESLYKRDKEEFRIDFGRHIEKLRQEYPHDYIKRLIRHCSQMRHKVPCIIFDNADHFTIEFQERAFQYARSIYENELCLVVIPITDRTSWQLSREGALRSFENETLFLPNPQPKTILQKRIEFIEERLMEEKKKPGQGYFVQRGISLSIDNLVDFAATLQTVFIKSGDVATWIGNLANLDIRRSLEIAKFIMISPHLDILDLVKTYVTSRTSIPPYKIKRALFQGQYDIYPTGEHPHILNIYALGEETESSPLLGVRILRLLRDAQKLNKRNPFMTIEQISNYFQAMQVDTSVTASWLQNLLKFGMCLSYDPTITDINHVGKLEISLAGFQHLYWGVNDSDYVKAMVEVTPLTDQNTYDSLSSLLQRSRKDVWKEVITTFVNYLISEDAQHCKIPDHDAFASQKRLASTLNRRLI